MSSKGIELILECKRQSENCLYSSVSLFIWLKFLRSLKVGFTVLPLIFGSLASWKLLTSADVTAVRYLTATLSFMAGLLPAIYSVLKLDDNLGEAVHLAGEFKNLQDRFRQAALISSKKPFEEFEQEAIILFRRLEEARGHSITPPEWCFRWAQKKIKKGDYDFDVDLSDNNLAAN